MLYLLQPIWMLLVSGITIPVFIHLWHRRPARVRKVGSIQLLAAATVKHARSKRVSEWWLLLLRCLLILLLALLLSQPVWRRPFTAHTQKGWVLVEPVAYTHFKPVIDSLLQAGYQLHAWDTAFESSTPGTWSPDTLQLPYWQTLQLLPKKIPGDLPVYLFTGQQLRRFQGNRPVLPLHLHWYTAALTDTAERWDALQYPLENGGTRILQGYSTGTGTRYEYHDTAATAAPPLRVTVYAGKYPADASYLYAALQAVQQYTRRKINITLVKAGQTLPQEQDWLWWLSEQPVPAGIQATRQVVYAAGKINQDRAVWAGRDISVTKRIITSANDNALLKDSYGHTLLAKGDTLYTHLHPAWSEWVWNEQFPVYLLQWMFPAPAMGHHDRRNIDPVQLQPVLITPDKITHPVTISDNQEKTVWILLLLVFCIERYLSLRKRKEEAHG
ncbi:BatA domain-containing protein [Chitinophaga nivalis]|uniref:BatA domain-containing protein n=1 Tax=Chitinophaga nivalis TaxID=2991709 RepID=A0ABT3IHF9_9BACT|nr:BatA domain-containing protein [Chitinophaga nivalis]MCW3466931.1 BatA domain-containing protein [Chitinophaga nivalis]MCW3483378.1 BatA domain-containing protein [Chitinophaga nivalis]